MGTSAWGQRGRPTCDTFRLPSPSFCGSYPPQSCIFSQFLNMGAAMGMCQCSPSSLRPQCQAHPGEPWDPNPWSPTHCCLLPAAWTCILRYHQLRDWGVRTWLNQIVLWTGLLCTLGTSMVANFQVGS